MGADLANAAFELLGGAMLWANVNRLRRDRVVRGVHWQTTAVFMSWGVWNLFYYPNLDQWASFVGGLFLCSANAAWLWLAWHFRPSNTAQECALTNS
jgi:hypothetical protein